jgi:dipeptidase E
VRVVDAAIRSQVGIAYDEDTLMRLLLISSGQSQGGRLLEGERDTIAALLPANARRIVFIPYAAVEVSYDEYVAGIAPVMTGDLGREVIGIHSVPEGERAALVREADAILVGGGNTFKLLGTLRREGLLPVIRERGEGGTPYIGWSAGANIACPTIGTTNDMPIAEPGGFDALGLVPFQVNPHYLHGNPPGFEGETREARLLEYVELHRDVTVVGLREGTMLEVVDGAIRLIGAHPCRVVSFGRAPVELDATADVSFLLTGDGPPDLALEGRSWRLAARLGPDGAWLDVPAEVRATATFGEGGVAGSGGAMLPCGVAIDGATRGVGRRIDDDGVPRPRRPWRRRSSPRSAARPGGRSAPAAASCCAVPTGPPRSASSSRPRLRSRAGRGRPRPSTTGAVASRACSAARRSPRSSARTGA